MKQIILLLLFLFSFGAQSYAVNPVNVDQEKTSIKVDSDADHNFTAKVKTFFTKMAKKVKSIFNALGEVDEVLIIILAIVLPPLGLYFYEGETWTKRCTVNLILTLLCGLPGMIHALVIILGKK